MSIDRSVGLRQLSLLSIFIEVIQHKAPPTSSESNSNYVCINVFVFLF